jgi:membrane protease YdiL (CAAX protease family)
MSRLYQPTAVLALVLFVGLAALHIAVLLGFPAPSAVSAFTIFPFVFAGQLIAIHGLNGGTLRSSRGKFNPVRKLRLGLAGLRYIPVAWRLFGLPFWYLYMPATFFWLMSHMPGQLHAVNGEFVLTEHGRVLKTLTATQAAAARADEFCWRVWSCSDFCSPTFFCFASSFPTAARFSRTFQTELSQAP